ncbi:MAG: family 43 glycosylhydrolase [Pricia sp.]
MIKKILFAVFLVFYLSSNLFAQTSSIRNGISWFDDNGDRIRANGASILQHNGTYYMTGMDFTDDFGGLFGGDVKLYSSTDLVNWTFEGVIIEASANPELESGERFLVRPNLVYNESTDKFIIWSGYKNRSLTFGAIAVFSSDTVDGTYKFDKEIQPLGYDSNDSCMFVDDDGTAYYISNSKDDQSLNIYALTSDYMDIASTAPTILFPGQSKEAPVVFKKEGTYYLMNSRKTGWDPNQGQYASSTSMTEGWSGLRNFGNRLTYDTQPTTFFTVNGSATTSYFYVGDRWRDPDLRESKIIFLPIEASNGNLSLNYVPELTIDMQTGAWAPFDDNEYVPQDDWSLVSVSSQENTTTFSAENVFDGNINTIWNTRYTSGNDAYPHEMVIDLGDTYDVSGFMCVPRQDASGNAISDFQLFLSEDGLEWDVPVAAGRMSYWSELYFTPKRARFMKLIGHKDINGSRFASAAEFRLMTSSEYRPGRTINPYFNPDGKGWRAGDKVLVERGGSALIGVQTEFGGGQTAFYGSYSYHGPDDYYAATRIINLQNVDEAKLGTYTVTYLDDSFSVQQHTYDVAFTMQTDNLSQLDVTCNGDATGSASIQVSGGFPPYTYSWSDGQDTAEASNLEAGDYEVVVSDSEGNELVETVSIDEPSPLAYSFTEDQKIYLGYGPECVTLSAQDITGGAGEYSFLWSTGELTQSIEVCPTETTIFELEVTDLQGCTMAKTVTVEVEDVNCSKKNDKPRVLLCWKGKTKCVKQEKVQELLNMGATLGTCSDGNQYVVQDLVASPNPTSGIFELRAFAQEDSKINLSLRNPTGAIVMSRKARMTVGENTFVFNLYGRPSGIYYLEVSGGTIDTETLKIIKE